MIVVVGVGALGSHLVQFLRNIDLPIKVIDFDRVEQKNVQSQFHARNSVGKKKVQALTQLMQFAYNRKILGVSNKLTDDNCDQLLGGATVIIDCLDNGESRRLVQNFAKETNTPCLHGALAADGAFGRVMWTEQFAVDDESAVGTPTCEDGEALPFIAIAASCLARTVQRFVANGQKTNYSISASGIKRL